MSFALIICTYQRPQPIVTLLDSIARQSVYPDQIVIVDASTNHDTRNALGQKNYRNVEYFLVDDAHRGLTKQRNYGISKVKTAIDFVCFLDDDTVASPRYFENLIQTYADFPEAMGVGGYISNEVQWQPFDGSVSRNKFTFDGWQREEPLRFRIRKLFGLDTNVAPGFSPLYSHGRSVGFLPPSGKVYAAEQLMGGVSSFRKIVFETYHFSEYFEGYGLYEDADFCLRLAKSAPLYINTSAQVAHYHAASGRPNQFNYGKMVVRNGWYVWHVKNPTPTFSDACKWHLITHLLALIRLSNITAKKGRKEAFTESAGRFAGWFSILFDPPLVRQ